MKNKQNAEQHRFLSKLTQSLRPNLNYPVSLNSFNLTSPLPQARNQACTTAVTPAAAGTTLDPQPIAPRGNF